MVQFLVFFFKQKTAYEMRISDWSSDVCSSDLGHCTRHGCCCWRWYSPRWRCPRLRSGWGRSPSSPSAANRCWRRSRSFPAIRASLRTCRRGWPRRRPSRGSAWSRPTAPSARSEEHTSELQSLMRISYAVFCLKKKKNRQPHTNKPKKKHEHTKTETHKKTHHTVKNNLMTKIQKQNHNEK